jgi:hypothetical protein
MKLVLLLLALLLIAGATTGQAAVEKLTNGGFESGSTGWISGMYGSSTIVATGTYGVSAAEGSHFLDARLNDYTGWPKTVVAQSTALPSTGIWYELTGWIYPHLSGGLLSRQASITIDWGDGTIQRMNPSVNTDWNWVGSAHFMQFNSPSPISVYLEIYGAPPAEGDFVLFDGISIMEYSSAVPEPTCLSALAVLAISSYGFARPRRRRRM